MEWWNMDAYKCEMDMDEQTHLNGHFFYVAKKMNLNWWVLRSRYLNWIPGVYAACPLRLGTSGEAESCVLSLPTSPLRLDLDCKLTTSFIRERLNDIITQSPPQSASGQWTLRANRETGLKTPMNWWNYLRFKQDLDEILNNCNEYELLVDCKL